MRTPQHSGHIPRVCARLLTSLCLSGQGKLELRFLHSYLLILTPLLKNKLPAGATKTYSHARRPPPESLRYAHQPPPAAAHSRHMSSSRPVRRSLLFHPDAFLRLPVSRSKAYIRAPNGPTWLSAEDIPPPRAQRVALSRTNDSSGAATEETGTWGTSARTISSFEEDVGATPCFLERRRQNNFAQTPAARPITKAVLIGLTPVYSFCIYYS